MQKEKKLQDDHFFLDCKEDWSEDLCAEDKNKKQF